MKILQIDNKAQSPVVTCVLLFTSKKELDWEAELAVVIGKKGKNIQASLAKDYIFGFTVAHDVTARDWQLKKNGGQWPLEKLWMAFVLSGLAS